MTRRSRGITVVIQRDGMTRSQTVRLSLWTIRLVLLGGVCLLAGLGLLAVLYLPIVRAAARVPGLERQVARLTSDNAKVRQLSIELDSVEMRYAQLRQMIGADIVRDPLALSSSLPLAPPVQARVADAPPPRPRPDGTAGMAARRSRLCHPRTGGNRHSGRGPSGTGYRSAGRNAGQGGRWRQCGPGGGGS